MYALDVAFMTELINGVFTNTELDGASLAEQFPGASEEMIAAAVKDIEGMYQWYGYNFTPSMKNFKVKPQVLHTAAPVQAASSSSMLPYAIGAAALLSGYLYVSKMKKADTIGSDFSKESRLV